MVSASPTHSSLVQSFYIWSQQMLIEISSKSRTIGWYFGTVSFPLHEFLLEDYFNFITCSWAFSRDSVTFPDDLGRLSSFKLQLSSSTPNSFALFDCAYSRYPGLRTNFCLPALFYIVLNSENRTMRRYFYKPLRYVDTSQYCLLLFDISW